MQDAFLAFYFIVEIGTWNLLVNPNQTARPAFSYLNLLGTEIVHSIAVAVSTWVLGSNSGSHAFMATTFLTEPSVHF